MIQLSHVMPHMSVPILRSLCSKGLVIKVADIDLAISVADHLVITMVEYLPADKKCTTYFNTLCNNALRIQSHSINSEIITYLMNQGATPPADKVLASAKIQLEHLNKLSAWYCMCNASDSSLKQFLKTVMQSKPIGETISIFKKFYGSFLVKLVQNIERKVIRVHHKEVDEVACNEAESDHSETLLSDETDDDLTEDQHESHTDIVSAQDCMYHFENLDWEVECSSHVYKILKSKHFPPHLQKSFFLQLQKIASGHHPVALRKPVIKDKGPPLYEARLSKASRIIWEVAKQFSSRDSQVNNHIYTEVIRVWDIEVDHDKLHKKISKVNKKRQDFNYHHASIQVKLIACTNTKSGPKQFIEAGSSTAKEHQEVHIFTPATCSADTGNSVATFYSCSFEFVNSILNSSNNRRDFPFKEWPKEHDIINMPEGQPILLLGRSGTGKSLCCLYRMWNLFKHFWKKARPAHGIQLHQIFVTKNKHLCDYTKKCFYNMAASQNYLNKHMKHEKKKLPNVLSKVSNLSYPLFLTSREFLVLLDNSLDGAHFFPGAATEVTASYFETSIWPKLKNKSWKFNHFNPTLVWMEIISIIKGSYEAMQQPKGCLSKEQYISIGQKMAPTFSQDDKAHIYAIFELYQKYLLQNKAAFDECDLLHNIHNRFFEANPRAQRDWTISHFYVDEVQDFTQAELNIITQLSSEPNNLFLTGDTAQTIMKGVYFRFCDLRSLFYHMQQKASHIKIPEIMTLEINFRSHSGILNLAASVIDLMKHYFSRFFDSHLPSDQGIYPGPTPIICLVKNIASVFKNKSPDDASNISFGANQAIIVRNDEAKQQLIESKKLEGIILTVYEAKGLEFTDVLLYNIFDASQVSLNN